MVWCYHYGVVLPLWWGASTTMISLLTSAKTDVGAAIKAAESVVETVNIRLAGTPAGGLPVGAQLDRRQDGDDGAGGLAGSGRLLHLSPVRNWRD